jgi:hypothetical protein
METLASVFWTVEASARLRTDKLSARLSADAPLDSWSESTWLYRSISASSDDSVGARGVAVDSSEEGRGKGGGSACGGDIGGGFRSGDGRAGADDGGGEGSGGAGGGGGGEDGDSASDRDADGKGGAVAGGIVGSNAGSDGLFDDATVAEEPA